MNEVSEHPAQRRSYDERYKAGKLLRAAAPRENLGDFSASERDPVAIFQETNQGRLPELLPLRYERMAASPFAFLRGAAALMAVDLANQAIPGISVQACGDCHLMNFGAFLSPEGHVLFDINDFDETLPGVDFTVDVKRLAASFAVAALAAGDNDKTARRVARNAAKAYRQRVAKLAALSPLEAWHSRVILQREADGLFDDAIAKKLRLSAARKHADREEDANFPHLSHDATIGEWRVEDRPPLIYHVSDHDGVDLAAVFAGVTQTLAPEVKNLLTRYRLADSVFKVVGVGSVGTYCAVGLFASEDDQPLFLQFKEALPSALERLGGAPWPQGQGERVVSGQRIMQAASDLFLGWTVDATSGRHFYMRHLKNRRLGSVGELLEAEALPQYATLCGLTLARAHARSGDAATLSGYMGKSEAFDDAIASFAMLYAAQNKRDFKRFVAAKGDAASSEHGVEGNDKVVANNNMVVESDDPGTSGDDQGSESNDKGVASGE